MELMEVLGEKVKILFKNGGSIVALVQAQRYHKVTGLIFSLFVCNDQGCTTVVTNMIKSISKG